MCTKSSITSLFRNFARFTVFLIIAYASNVSAQYRPFINISTRAQVLNGQTSIVAGFTITSTATNTKQVLIRGMGPSTGVSGYLTDPTITLNGPDGSVIFSNNNWKDSQQSAIAATGFQPGNDLESAILWPLAPGAYTVTLGGNNGATGVGVVEVYDMGGGPGPAMVNLSSRAQVGTGNNVLIGGVYVQDSGRAVVRGIGPSLGNYGIQGALQNPMITVVNASGTQIAANDNWQSDPGATEMQGLGLQPSNLNESATIASFLSTGPYTVVVSGVSNTTGIAQVELYALDTPYPRVFQAWANADYFNESTNATVARHDLLWTTHNGFGWYWQDANGNAYTNDFRSETFIYTGALAYDIPTLRNLNPRIKILSNIEHYAASFNPGDANYLPAGHTWYKQPLVPSPYGGGQYLLNQDDTTLQDHVANQAQAMMATGQFDGVMLDICFPNTSYLSSLLTKVRNAIGPNGLIIINANDSLLSPAELNQINGVFMESGQLTTPTQWQNAKAALDLNESQTRSPRVNCLETWFVTSRTDVNDLKRMRATTCLSLTHSNGFALFGDANHNHMWYDFWSNHRLGWPTGPHTTINNTADRRDFTNGSAIWNAVPGGSVTVTFPQTRKSLATGQIGTTFTLTGIDGDIYLISY